MPRPKVAFLKWWPYALLVVVLGVAIAVGASRQDPGTIEDQTLDIAATLKCPECTDKSMGASDAPTSVAGRDEIRRQLEAGQSSSEIRSWFEDRYGSSILLTPSSSGVEGLIWVIPVVVIVSASAALAALFMRWRKVETHEVSDADRDLVTRALGEAKRDT